MKQEVSIKRIREAFKGYYGERIGFNTLSQQITIDDNPIDSFELECAYLLADEHLNIQAAKSICRDALESAARGNSYHPFVKYLDSLLSRYQAGELEPFDLEDVLTSFFLLDHDDAYMGLYKVFLRKWLIALVARQYQPGTKYDHVLILKGKQGAMKSTFFKTMVGEQFFTDSFSLPASGEVGFRQLQTIHKFSAIELAELGKRITGRYEASDAVKAFLSATRDDFIPMYGRKPEERERGFIFCGTVNDESGFLSDATGNRRFQIIPILNSQSHPIDIERLRRERDAILLAAVLAFQSGEPLFLPKELAVSAEEANTAYVQDVSLLEEVMRWAALRDRFTAMEVWTEVFRGEPRDYDVNKGRVGRTLAQIPWIKAGQKIRSVEGRRINGYVVDNALRKDLVFRSEVADLAQANSLAAPEPGKEAKFLEEIF